MVVRDVQRTDLKPPRGTAPRAAEDRRESGFTNHEHHLATICVLAAGEVRQEFSVVFTAKPIGGTPKTSNESSEVIWVPVAKLQQLTMHPTMRERIAHYLERRPVPYIA